MRLMLVPALAGALADAESAIDAIQLTARRRSPQFRAQAWANAAAASASMENVDGRLVAAMMIELDELRGVRSSLLQVAARLHTAAAVDLPMQERGRPHPGFTESDRLTALAELVSRSSAPALLVASIAHAELLAMAPFSSANGVVARAISRAIMIESGLDPTGMVLTEVGLRDLGKAAYADALERYRSATTDGVTAWVVHCSRAVELGVDALRQLLTPAQQ